MNSKVTFVCLLSCLILMAGCGGKKSTATLPARELFTLAMENYQNEKYLDAIERFQDVIYNYPGEPYVDTAQYYLALSYFGQEEYALAKAEFTRLTNNYPLSPFVISAQFMQAVCDFESTPKHYALDQTELHESIRRFEDFLIDHPESERIPDAQKYLDKARERLAQKMYANAITYTHIGAHKAAKIYFQHVVDNYTSSEFAPLALYGIAESDYKLKQYEDAGKKFDDFLSVYPSHRLADKARHYAIEASFRAGESAYEKGEMSSARTRLESFRQKYPDHKYSSRASSILRLIPPMPPDSIASDSVGS